MPEHNELVGAQLHPPRPLTFTGDVAAYTPPAAGFLVVKTDVTPYALYLSTGTTAGALAAIGAGGGGDPDPGGYDADAQAWIDRLTGTYSETELDAINAFVLELKGDSLASSGTMWDLTGFWLRAVDNIADSRLNAKGTSYALAPATGEVFTARAGVANDFDGADSGINPDVVASNVNTMVFAYSRTDFSTFGSPVASTDGSNPRFKVETFLDGGTDPQVAADINLDVNSFAAPINLDIGEGISQEGGLAIIRRPLVLTGVLNQHIMTPSRAVNSSEDDAAFIADGGTLRFGEDDKQYAAFAYDHSRIWTDAEAQRFNGYVETLLDAFGAGVIS